MVAKLNLVLRPFHQPVDDISPRSQWICHHGTSWWIDHCDTEGVMKKSGLWPTALRSMGKSALVCAGWASEQSWHSSRAKQAAEGLRKQLPSTVEGRDTGIETQKPGFPARPSFEETTRKRLVRHSCELSTTGQPGQAQVSLGRTVLESWTSFPRKQVLEKGWYGYRNSAQPRRASSTRGCPLPEEQMIFKLQEHWAVISEASFFPPRSAVPHAKAPALKSTLPHVHWI